MACDPALEARLQAALADIGPLVWEPITDGVRVMLDGHMLCAAGQHDGHGYFLFRPGWEQAAAAVVAGLGRPVKVDGRMVPGFVMVLAQGYDDEELRDWIALSRAEVARLPPKG